MRLLEIHWIIWASNEKMAMLTEKMNDRFGSATPISGQLFQFTVLLVILVIVVVAIYFLSKTFRLTEKNTLNSDFRSIYQKLCTVHRLSFQERLLIRKVIKAFGIVDPLLIFVEPKYFHSALTRKDFKANRTMLHHLINKLFGFASDKESLSRPSEQLQVVDTTDLLPDMDFSQIEFPEEMFQIAPPPEPSLELQTTPPVYATEQELPEEMPFEVLMESPDRKKPFYPRIPGSQAFSSLASTIHEVRSEIASKSLQHNLLSGRENNRTFKVHHLIK